MRASRSAAQMILFAFFLLGDAMADAKDDLAFQLVHALKADVIVIELAQKQVEAAYWSRDVDRDQRECLLKIDSEFVVRGLKRLARELNAEETRAAIAYFESPIGKQHRELMRAEVGLSRATLLDYSADERAAFIAFLDTPAGYRLVTRSLLTGSPEVRNLARMAAFDSRNRCLP